MENRLEAQTRHKQASHPPILAQATRAPWLPETPVKTPPPPPPRLLLPPGPVVAACGHSSSAAVQAMTRKVYRQLRCGPRRGAPAPVLSPSRFSRALIASPPWTRTPLKGRTFLALHVPTRRRRLLARSPSCRCRRAFALWPPGSPASLTPLITLWLSVIAPWSPVAAHTRRAAAPPELPPGAHAAHGGGGGGAPPGGAPGGGAHEGGGAGHALGSAAAAAGVVEATAARLQQRLPAVASAVVGSARGGGGGGGGGAGGAGERDVAGATSREALAPVGLRPGWLGLD
jgi:hypothetical protein